MEGNGEIWFLDVERNEPLAFLNSGIREFIEMFVVLDGLCGGGAQATSFQLARDALRKLEPARFEESDWNSLLGYAESHD